MDEEVIELRVPPEDVQQAVNAALINLLDPSVDRKTADLQIDKIRKIKALEG